MTTTTIAREIANQMNDNDRATYTREAWREGIANMLVGDWADANLDDVLDKMELAIYLKTQALLNK